MNRRWFGLLLILALPACAKLEPQYPPEEVLRRAATAAQTVQSARFTVEGTFATSGGFLADAGGSFTVNGILQEGGREVESSLQLSLTTRGTDEEPTVIRASIRTVLTTDDRLYLSVDALESEPKDSVFRPEARERVIGRWWTATPGAEHPPVSLTPSPHLLHTQASVVVVERDLGMTEIGGTPVYRYAVRIDPDRFLAYARALSEERGAVFDEAALREDLGSLHAQGELWIDARQFTLRRIQWTIPGWALPDGSLARLQFSAHLTDYDRAPSITVPVNAEPFPWTDLLLPALPSRVSGEWNTPEGIGRDALETLLRKQSETLVFPPRE
jgi:hypothetical protein